MRAWTITLIPLLLSGCLGVVTNDGVNEPRPPTMEVHIEPDVLTDQINITVTRIVHDPYTYESSGGQRWVLEVYNSTGKVTSLYEYGGQLEYSFGSTSERTLRPGTRNDTFNWNGHIEERTDEVYLQPHGGERVSPGEYRIHVWYRGIDSIQENITIDVLAE